MNIELSLLAESFITIRPGNIDLGPVLERPGATLVCLFVCRANNQDLDISSFEIQTI